MRFLILFLLACGPAAAEIRMPSIFGDNMVLQQGRDLPVWGTAAPGEEVTVSIAGQTAKTTAGADGQWKASLKPLAADGTPLEMRVSGSNTLVFRNVLAGDVWICSGQSNMALPLSRVTGGHEAAQQANIPGIRFFVVAKKGSFAPESDTPSHWKVCTPEEAASFSSVGFFFGRELYGRRKIPLGLIGSYWGGSPAAAWTSLEKLASQPELKAYAESFRATKSNLPALQAKYEAEVLPRWKAEMEKWQASPEPKGKRPRQPHPPGQDGRVLATLLFNGMINPLIPYGIKGVIWYQGEANASKAQEYAVLFPAMIRDWRERWEQGDFPFLFVQLPGYYNPDWVAQREAQKKALDLPATAMVVALDLGEEKELHPKNKQPVGQRLALAARHVAYGEDVVYSGPVFKGLTPRGNTLVVAFDHVGGGLKAGTPTGEAAPKLSGFEVAGTDGKFFPAQAKIEGPAVIVSSDKVAQPAVVRYAWAPWPKPMANLYNAEGLPAAPFHSQPEPLKAGPEPSAVRQ